MISCITCRVIHASRGYIKDMLNGKLTQTEHVNLVILMAHITEET